MRALALGDDDALRSWIANESAGPLARARARTREDLDALAQAGARIVALGDDDYPAALRELTDPPPFLTVRGALFTGGVAIVGTRTPHRRAVEVARALARRLGHPVVSGLAHGIDAAAHEGALDAGIATLAYVGSGILRVYPPEHASLQARILAAGGAVASERLPDEAVTRWSLVRRDRLQAAHARAVVLIATDREGGAMHTMGFAARLGRPRFAVEDDPAIVGDGNAAAICEGARALPLDADAAAAIVAPSLTTS